MKRKQLSPRRRLVVWQRDRFACAYCGASALSDTSVVLEVDHIAPVSEGGSNDFDNLTTACRPCNQKKGPHATGPRTRKARPPYVESDAEIALRQAQRGVMLTWHASLEKRFAEMESAGIPVTRDVILEDIARLDAAMSSILLLDMVSEPVEAAS